MPILARDVDMFPEDLFADGDGLVDGQRWWALYTRSRREKQLMRCLLAHKIAFYAPLLATRRRSPNGRVRTAHLPVFPGYVFMRGTDEQRLVALTSNCISRTLVAPDAQQLYCDLRQIRDLIATGAPLTVEDRLEAGDYVRVRSGPFAGFEGTVLKRHGKTRLVVAVWWIQRGASVLLEDCQLERLGNPPARFCMYRV